MVRERVPPIPIGILPKGERSVVIVRLWLRSYPWLGMAEESEIADFSDITVVF